MTKLFTNTDAVTLEVAAVKTAKTELQLVADYLKGKNIPLNIESLTRAVHRNFTPEMETFKNDELEKIANFKKQFGEMAGFGDTTERIEQAAKDLYTDLRTNAPKISYQSSLYVDWFTLTADGTLELLPDHSDIEAKHSIYAEEAKLKKHEKAISLLNDLMAGEKNEYTFFDKYFIFNPETKQFSINIQAYDTENELNFIKERTKTVQFNEQYWTN